MGTKLSLTKDYNRVLAKQPQQQIILLKANESESTGQSPIPRTFSIPDFVRISSSKNKLPNEPSNFRNNPDLIKSSKDRDFPRKNEYHTSAERSLVTSRNFAHFRLHDPTMNNEATVIGRTFFNLNDSGRLNDNQYNLSLFRSNRSTIQHNGKQFSVELRERMERRRVQIFDPNLGRMRLFEVTDYIPTKVIRSVGSQSIGNQPPLSLHNLLPGRIPILNPQGQQLASSRLMNFNSSNFTSPIDNSQNPVRKPKQFSDNANTQGPASRPSNSQDGKLYNAAYTTKSSVEPPLSNSNNNIPEQYGSSLYRSQGQSLQPYSSALTDDSASTIEVKSSSSDNSSDSNNEHINKTSSYYMTDIKNKQATTTNNAQGTESRQNARKSTDPFARLTAAVNLQNAQPDVNNEYSLLSSSNRAFPTSTRSDYATLSSPGKQPSRDQIYKSTESNAYDG